MLSEEDKKDFLKLAVPCLRREEVPFPTLKEIEEKKPKPTEKELNLIKQGIETGDVSDNLLKKLFRWAYAGVSEHGVYKYFFLIHNEIRMNLPEPIANWCTVYPADVIEKIDSEYTVKIIGGKEMKSDLKVHPDYPNLRTVREKDINIGSHIALHRDKIAMVLDEGKYKKAMEFYSEFLKTKETK